jgi:hypothetical protein
MMSDERRELEGRIDHVLAVARSSERAALEIGAAAFDAADQARRAADLAVALASGVAAEPLAGATNGVNGARAESAGPADAPELALEPALRHFTERADRVVARLRALDRLPAASSAS